MTQESRPRLTLGLYLWMWAAIPAGLFALLVLYLFTLAAGTPKNGKTDPDGRGAQVENYLAGVRTALAKETRLSACVNVVALINAHVRQGEGVAVPALAEDEVKRLAGQLRLEKGDVEELTRATYTALDARHMEACFLFRDAARSLEITPVSNAGKFAKQSALDRAAAGFDWVVRQVRLQAPLVTREATPPGPALRRGHGAEIERALVFLALLEQFGLDEGEDASLQGCLLFCPDEKKQPRLWACGVALGSGSDGLYLFDPRLGMAVPGPGGKGVATLAQAQADPKILAALAAGGMTYDVTAEQAKEATAQVVCPLSACSARMLYLQDRLLRDKTWLDKPLPAPVRVRLAETPDVARRQIAAAFVKGGGKDEGVTLSQDAPTLFRRFLPPEEGGSDAGIPVQLGRLGGFVADDVAATLPRQQAYRLEAVPWSGFPVEFRNPVNFGPGLRLGQRLRGIYMAPFVASFLEPESPRDQTLRGQHSLAVPVLVREQDKWLGLRRRTQEADTPELRATLPEWVRGANEIYAALARGDDSAKKAEADLWRLRPDGVVAVMLNGGIAGPLGSALLYELALTRQEQAIRHAARVELAGRADLLLAGDVAAAAKAWASCEVFWREFAESHADRPGIADAKRRRAEALLALGRGDEAKKLFADASAPMTALEKLAQAYRAERIGK